MNPALIDMIEADVRAGIPLRQALATRYVALVDAPTLDAFPELNMGNYNDDNVKNLNDWGIELVTTAFIGRP